MLQQMCFHYPQLGAAKCVQFVRYKTPTARVTMNSYLPHKVSAELMPSFLQQLLISRHLSALAVLFPANGSFNISSRNRNRHRNYGRGHWSLSRCISWCGSGWNSTVCIRQMKALGQCRRIGNSDDHYQPFPTGKTDRSGCSPDTCTDDGRCTWFAVCAAIQNRGRLVDAAALPLMFGTLEAVTDDG